MNTRQRLKKKIHQYLTNWTIWNKSDEFWNSAVNSLFYGAFSPLSSSSSSSSLKLPPQFCWLQVDTTSFDSHFGGLAETTEACTQALHFTARIVACEQGFVERGVDFSSRDDYRSYSPSGWILPLPPPQRGRLESLLAVYAKYEDNTFVKNSLLPFFDKDKTTLLPYLRFRRTNTSPCLVLVQEKCNVCYHYNRVTQYFLTGNRGCGDSFEAKNIWDQYLQN